MKYLIFALLILSTSCSMTQTVYIQDVEPIDRVFMDSIMNPIPQQIKLKQ